MKIDFFHLLHKASFLSYWTFLQSTLIFIQNLIPWHSNCSDLIKCNSTPSETHLRPSPSVIQGFFFGMLQKLHTAILIHNSEYTQEAFYRIPGSIATQQTGLIHLCKQFTLSPVPSLLCFWGIDRILTNTLTKALIQCLSSIQMVSSQKIPVVLVLLVIIHRVCQPQCHICRMFYFIFVAKIFTTWNILHLFKP